MSILSAFNPRELYYQLRAGGPASTFDRLLKSRHVVDLRIIFVVAFCIGTALIVAAVVEAAVLQASPTSYIFAAIAASGAVMAWAYQAGSARLGIVDIFACEIATLCRVCTITDLVPRLVAQFRALETGDTAAQHPNPIGDQFDPRENYEPVFDNSARDLQVLDVTVVTNVTQFYTYLKSMRDMWRRLGAARTAAERKLGLIGIIYMQFLAFESARFAIADLVEFEPNEADNTLVIMLSELPAFDFLLRELGKAPTEQKDALGQAPMEQKDLRYQRLKLRVDAYKKSIPDTYCRVTDVRTRADPAWEKLQATAEDLRRCYKDTFGEDIDVGRCRERLEEMRKRQAEARRNPGALAGGVTSMS